MKLIDSTKDKAWRSFSGKKDKWRKIWKSRHRVSWCEKKTLERIGFVRIWKYHNDNVCNNQCSNHYNINFNINIKFKFKYNLEVVNSISWISFILRNTLNSKSKISKTRKVNYINIIFRVSTIYKWWNIKHKLNMLCGETEDIPFVLFLCEVGVINDKLAAVDAFLTEL